MQNQLFNSEHLGEITPWFGPLLPGYHCIFNSTNVALADEWPQDLVAWVWNQQGELVGEKVIRPNQAGELTTIDADRDFPELAGQAGTIGIVCRAKDSIAKSQIWVGRYITRKGKLAGALFSGNPINLNFPKRSGRPSTYRMCSQELLVDSTWRTLSWHGNVSADPTYARPIRAELFVLDKNGKRLDGPDVTIPAFGSVLIDLEEIFGKDTLRNHLAATAGRGSYMMHSKDGGAIGYHFLQHRTTHELASDHTRPVVYYLSRAYGWSQKADAQSAAHFVRSVARYLKFRLGA